MKLTIESGKEPKGHKEEISWHRIQSLLESISQESPMSPPNKIIEIKVDEFGLKVYWENPVR